MRASSQERGEVSAETAAVFSAVFLLVFLVVSVVSHAMVSHVAAVSALLGAPREAYTQTLIAAVSRLEPRRARPNTGAIVMRARNLVKNFRTTGWFGGGEATKLLVDSARKKGLTVVEIDIPDFSEAPG